MPSDAVNKVLERDIHDAHERFLSAMTDRLRDMHLETKERYFVILSSLVGKLEDSAKPLRDILHETVSENASLIFDELSR